MHTDDLDTVFRANAKRPMELTRFFNIEMLRTLDLYDEVKRLFDNIGWGAHVTNAWPTYREPTLEVLITYIEDHKQRENRAKCH